MRERLAIIVAAVLVRLLCLGLFDPATSFATGDSPSFFAGAAMQAPGYPAFLDVAPFPLVIQSLLTIAVALLAHDRLPRGGFVAALLIAASPFLPAYEWRIMSDCLSWQLIFAAFILIAFPRAKWEIIAAGILLGLAALVRDTYQWLPLWALLWALLLAAGMRKRMGVAALIAYFAVLPWQLSQGRVAISEGRMGYNLWVGTWERDNSWMIKGLVHADYPANAFTSDEQRRYLFELPLLTPASDRRFKAAAIDNIKADPVGTVSTWIARYPKLWLGTRSDQIAWRIDKGPLWFGIKAGLWGLNLVILLLGAAGVVMNWRRYPLLLAPIFYVALVYIPFHNTETRYTLGALPFLMVFATEAIWGLANRLHSQWPVGTVRASIPR